MKTLTEKEYPYVKLEMKAAKLIPETEIFEVNQAVDGMFIRSCQILQERLNFTQNFVKIKSDFAFTDWGTAIEHENGTKTFTGLIKYIAAGEADMVCAR